MYRHLIFAAFISICIPIATARNNYPDFTKLVEDFSDSVVNISAVKERDSSENASPFWPFFRGIPRQDNERYTPKPRSQGSGFVISKDGFILTNNHVVEGATKVSVTLNNDREFTAEIVGQDPATDVALLKIDAKGLQAVKVGDAAKLKVGEWVLAFGAPFGFDRTVTAGIISAKARQLGNEIFVPFIQSDVAINPGNSGGPLVNMKGEVVGINSQIISRSGGYIGLSFSIPIDLAMEVSQQLKEHGEVKRGFLGVGYQEVTEDDAKSFGLDKPMGALVNDVTADSPADEAGIEPGDIIVEFNGFPINRHEELPIVVGRHKPGQKVEIKYYRNGKLKETKVKLVERPKVGQPLSRGATEELGLNLRNLNDDEQRQLDTEGGVIVTGVSEGVAGEAGVRQGDVILAVNREKVSNVNDFTRIMRSMKPGDPVSLLVSSRMRGKRFISFKLPQGN
ncbi:MAG: DegQ family serine endoprotease [Pseudomonadota bacterium]